MIEAEVWPIMSRNQYVPLNNGESEPQSPRREHAIVTSQLPSRPDTSSDEYHIGEEKATTSSKLWDGDGGNRPVGRTSGQDGFSPRDYQGMDFDSQGGGSLNREHWYQRLCGVIF